MWEFKNGIEENIQHRRAIHSVIADSNSEFITIKADLSDKDEQSKICVRPGKKLARVPQLTTRIA